MEKECECPDCKIEMKKVREFVGYQGHLVKKYQCEKCGIIGTVQ